MWQFIVTKSKTTDHIMQACGGFRIITAPIFSPVYIIHTVVSLYITRKQINCHSNENNIIFNHSIW